MPVQAPQCWLCSIESTYRLCPAAHQIVLPMQNKMLVTFWVCTCVGLLEAAVFRKDPRGLGVFREELDSVAVRSRGSASQSTLVGYGYAGALLGCP